MFFSPTLKARRLVKAKEVSLLFHAIPTTCYFRVCATELIKVYRILQSTLPDDEKSQVLSLSRWPIHQCTSIGPSKATFLRYRSEIWLSTNFKCIDAEAGVWPAHYSGPTSKSESSYFEVNIKRAAAQGSSLLWCILFLLEVVYPPSPPAFSLSLVLQPIPPQLWAKLILARTQRQDCQEKVRRKDSAFGEL